MREPNRMNHSCPWSTCSHSSQTSGCDGPRPAIWRQTTNRTGCAGEGRPLIERRGLLVPGDQILARVVFEVFQFATGAHWAWTRARKTQILMAFPPITSARPLFHQHPLPADGGHLIGRRIGGRGWNAENHNTWQNSSRKMPQGHSSQRRHAGDEMNEHGQKHEHNKEDEDHAVARGWMYMSRRSDKPQEDGRQRGRRCAEPIQNAPVPRQPRNL